jgi:hypothetical protein
VVQSHPDVAKMNEVQLAQAFAEAVTAVCYIERHPLHGQIAREIVEVSPVVEKAAGRPSFNCLFRFDPAQDRLAPTGNRPMRAGFQQRDLGLGDGFFSK